MGAFAGAKMAVVALILDRGRITFFLNSPQSLPLCVYFCEDAEAGIVVWEDICLSTDGAKKDGGFSKEKSEGVRELVSNTKVVWGPVVERREAVEVAKVRADERLSDECD
jgi:hypothetical protein